MAVGGVAVFRRRHGLRPGLRPRQRRTAVARLYALKGRRPDKPGGGHVLLARARARRAARARPAHARRRSRRLLPGAVTLLLPNPARPLPAGLRPGPGDARAARPGARPGDRRARRRALAGAAVQRQPVRRRRRPPRWRTSPRRSATASTSCSTRGELAGHAVDGHRPARATRTTAPGAIVREGAVGDASRRRSRPHCAARGLAVHCARHGDRARVRPRRLPPQGARQARAGGRRARGRRRRHRHARLGRLPAPTPSRRRAWSPTARPSAACSRAAPASASRSSPTRSPASARSTRTTPRRPRWPAATTTPTP